MPLAPSPLLPGTSPLPSPGGRPPDRKALRLGALLAIPALVLLLVVGQLLLPDMLFLAPALQAQAGGGGIATGPEDGSPAGTFQGFAFPWSRVDTNGGYNTPASAQNLKSEASVFHMNAVIIPVIADMPSRTDSKLCWHSTDGCDMNTLSDDQYKQAIQDALKVKLVPILELQVRQHDIYSSTDSPEFVGAVWSTLGHNISIGATDGANKSIGQYEQEWFDNYAAFAVHYAQMSASYHLPYFIIGDDLSNVTVDTSSTSAKGDPGGVPHVQGESCPSNAGRRDCEWRHVIHAIKSSSYTTIRGNHSQTGANYAGKLIYAASWRAPQTDVGGDVNTPEFEGITWWDAVDYIGVDAYFPLTKNSADADINTLVNAWHGTGDSHTLGGEHDIVSRLEDVADKFQKQVIFTGAGYASAPGSNSQAGVQVSKSDPNEQLNDMQALLLTFTGQSWWVGVFWDSDTPAAPRESQQFWSVSTAWAGNSLKSSKAAGQWLASYYKPSPLPCPGCGG